jgi:hypothetical protein
VRTAGAARWLPVVDAGGLWSQSFAKQFIGGDAPADLTRLALGKRFRLGGRDSGADWSSVLTMVFRDGVRLALIGLGIGLVASTLLARVMRSLLVKVSVIDVPTLAAVVAVLSAIAVLASALPARRATAVNPTDALRGS